MPDHSVVHRYARCVAYPEWGVGSVTGIYFTGGGDDVQQWARVRFNIGVRTVPAGTLQFVDFSKPDAAADRVERFLTAAQHATFEGNHALAAQRLIYARDADPTNTTVLRLLTLAFWQAGDLNAAGRAFATGRATRTTGPRRIASPRASTRTWARSTSPPRPPSAPSTAAPATPTPGSGSGACGCD